MKAVTVVCTHVSACLTTRAMLALSVRRCVTVVCTHVSACLTTRAMLALGVRRCVTAILSLLPRLMPLRQQL